MKKLLSEIIFSILSGKDYRTFVLATINERFIIKTQDLITDIFYYKKTGGDWISKLLADTKNKSGKDSKFKLLWYGGLNDKTVKNMTGGTSTKEVCLELGKKNIDSFRLLLNNFEKPQYQLRVTIKKNSEAVELDEIESIIFVNIISAMKLTIQGGAWSEVGKQTEKSLLFAIFQLLNISDGDYVLIFDEMKRKELVGNREIDAIIFSKDKKPITVELKLLGIGNPEIGDEALARKVDLFLIDRLTEMMIAEAAKIGVNVIEFRQKDALGELYKFLQSKRQLLKIKEASRWASDFLKRDISDANISYLVQYGKVRKYNDGNSVLVDVNDLKRYYESYRGWREANWKKRLGDDLNWALSFDYLREKDTTKHVHRLHPYKGKFIPQLVQYFIDDHTDEFKKDIYFKAGDIILDPFSGSGTTLVQAQEMGMHSIGIDISHFNCMIAETKLLTYDLALLEDEVKKIKQEIASYEADSKITAFENELLARMADFNNQYFPSPEFKHKAQRGQIDENRYAEEKEREILRAYNDLVKKYSIELNHFSAKNFLDKWCIMNVRKEIDFAFEQIKKIKDIKNKKILAVVLSRTIRSCRATTHSDLATLKEPQITTYYCWKHKKICKPLFSIKTWFDRYAIDTVYRLKTFAKLKTNSHYEILPADSRTVNIFKEVEKRNKKLHEILRKQKIKGIFTSPPYVGQIDYHEQHAYAYDLFGFERRDELEIGPLCKGEGAEARTSYVEGISKVLLNCRKFLVNDFDIFLVANDKYNLYPAIVEQAGMRIINQFKRPVLNRTERNKSPYSEIIFHLKNGK